MKRAIVNFVIPCLLILFVSMNNVSGEDFISLPIVQQDIQIPVIRPIVVAVIQRESRGNQYAVSDKGALGLMQVMPSTAKKVAQNLGVSYQEWRLLEDTAYNIKLGTAYLDAMLLRYDGSVVLALAAYNMGPCKVDRYIARSHLAGTGPELDKWMLKHLPRTTRHYVIDILSYMGAPSQS